MPIYRLLRESAFEPDVVTAMASAFDDACRSLGLAERTDPLRDLVARTVIEIAGQGERDPQRLCERTLNVLRDRGERDAGISTVGLAHPQSHPLR